jgi:hypothetical protein
MTIVTYENLRIAIREYLVESIERYNGPEPKLFDGFLEAATRFPLEIIILISLSIAAIKSNMSLSPAYLERGDCNCHTMAKSGIRGFSIRHAAIAVPLHVLVFDVKRLYNENGAAIIFFALRCTHYPSPRNRSHQDGFCCPSLSIGT